MGPSDDHYYYISEMYFAVLRHLSVSWEWWVSRSLMRWDSIGFLVVFLDHVISEHAFSLLHWEGSCCLLLAVISVPDSWTRVEEVSRWGGGGPQYHDDLAVATILKLAKVLFHYYEAIRPSPSLLETPYDQGRVDRCGSTRVRMRLLSRLLRTCR